MKNKNVSKLSENSGDVTPAKIDKMIRLLEDLYILQALDMGVGRDSIRSVLSLQTSRISKISKGLRKRSKNGQGQA